MHLWYETEKDKGETSRKAGFNTEPKGHIDGDMSGDCIQWHCKCFVIKNTEQTWNRFFCLVVLPNILQELDRWVSFPICTHRQWVFLMHCHLRSPLPFVATVFHPSSRAVTTSNDSVFPNRSQSFRTLTRRRRLDQAVLTHELKQPRSKSAQSLLEARRQCCHML